ncbi:MAG: phosphoribosylanthranilate isomerase [gamma proteobacterium symbiont of Bathyaustriella thionipta]|nr:phosphoribosylanthranilate isomerase [gamma proteobacterium symbiont of Bathyaustriella thionipta]MCU7950060.1 phosphoribosylanthranilate isomerase [gamma proteobacterium symbiont of Bathyaustriella thionipta]MCU7952545.1 phosphoribosylanthranilate isomerase [gamma proteobacterium symbiont of Bathyaustriella thionipta]MCU7958066.1 phosphoribosylanthranilate isomerase [gamma proteobacterium symbiont of Bathyaustriella thionipta]MCU7967404.1 phosphoribosylanthranilate isomerase [gamma proteoba
MTRVKICGITNSEDAKFASDNEADAVGLVFYPPSPRCVTIKQALTVLSTLPPFTSSVALFVDAQRQEIEQVLEQVPIDLIQFHGDEPEAFCASFNRPYIKAVRMKEGLDLYAVENRYASARGLLLDTYKKGVPGGTGETFNWDKVPHDLTLPIILAGGLVAENIAQAIKQVKPYAVDVSGGVEVSKGKKDQQKIIQFMRNAKYAEE